MIEKLGRLVGLSSIVFSSGIMIGIILTLFPAPKPVSAQVVCYPLTLTGSPLAGGTPTALPTSSDGCTSNTYTVNEVITLTSNPNSGYVFDKWSGNVVPDETNQFSMPSASVSITANYTLVQTCHVLSTANSPTAGGNNITVSPTNSSGCVVGAYKVNQEITLTPNPNSGYVFTEWSGSVTPVVQNKFLMPNTTANVIANFTQDYGCYKLTLLTNPVGGGNLTASPIKSALCSNGEYYVNETITLYPNPISGSTFQNWTGDVIPGSENKFKMLASAVNIIANYSENTGCRALSFAVTGSGSNPTTNPTSSPGCNAGRYTNGTSITLTPVPDANYHLSTWSGGTVSTSNKYTMGSTNVTITANYNPDTKCHILTLEKIPSAGGVPTAAASTHGCTTSKYEEGETVTLTQGTNSGYSFSSWSSTPTVIFTSNTFPMPTNDITVTANYERAGCRTLSLEHTGTGNNPTASPANSTDCTSSKYVVGEIITLTPNPGASYHLSTWSGGTVSAGNKYTMGSTNVTITANYNPDTKCHNLTFAGDPLAGGTPSAAASTHGCVSSYEEGETVTLTRGTNSGYTFATWSSTPTVIFTTDTFPMPTSVITVTANYLQCHTLILAHTGTGSDPTASPTKTTGCEPGKYKTGEVITLTSIPAVANHLSDWSGATVTASNHYTMGTADITITANYNPDIICHSMTLAGNPSTGGTPTAAASSRGCGNKYEEEEIVTLIQGTNSGYTFANWYSTPTVIFTLNTFPMPTNDITVTANYKRTGCHTLSLAYTGIGSNPTTSPDNSIGCASGKYVTGEIITLTPIPGANYHLSTWSEATVDTSSRYTMAAVDIRITATYKPDSYCRTLTLRRYPTTGGTPSATTSSRCLSNNKYEPGETVILRRGINTGYTFSKWSSTPSVIFTTDTFLMPTYDIIVTATYNERTGCHTLSRSFTGLGTIPTAIPTNSPGCNLGRYIVGSVIALTPHPGTNFHLSTWSGGTVDASNHYTMVATDIKITAIYNPDTNCRSLTLAGNPSTGGTPTSAASTHGCAINKYEEGETVILRKGTKAGYSFSSWSRTPNVIITSDTFNFKMPASDIKVTANYIGTCYTLKLANTGSGNKPTVNPTKSGNCLLGQYFSGVVITLTPKPDNGNHLSSWSGGTVNASNFYTTVAANITITANYNSDTKCHTLTLAGNPISGGTPTATPSTHGCGTDYEEGETVKLSKGTSSDYTFSSWSKTQEVIITSDIFSMPTSDIAVTANYQVRISCTSNQIPSTECEALKTLYDATDGNSWIHKDNWLTNAAPCTWDGVSCGGEQVTGLSLGSNRLAGSLPNVFDALPKLSWLILNNNSLTGSIPSSIGSLTSLGRLYLQYNTLSGTLPDISSLIKLTDIRINNNPSLSGNLPETLKTLTDLQTFYFATTGFCEPSDFDFQVWLMQRTNLTRTKIFCGAPYAVTPTSPIGPKTSPANIFTIQPTLRWNTVSSATKYSIIIYNKNGAKVYAPSPIPEFNAHCSVGQAQCYTYVTTDLSVGTDSIIPYHWQVRPENPKGNGAWSSPSYFTLYKQPAAARLISPLITSVIQPTFQWAADPIATHYYVLVKQGSTQLIKSWYTKAGVNCSTSIGSCKLSSPVVFQRGVTYNWSVMTYNPYAQTSYGPWSAPASFKVQ